MLKRAMRRIGWKVAPGRMSDRARRFEQQFRAGHHIPDSARRMVEAHGDTVLHGPFQGMRYPIHLLAVADAPVAKLLGIYEAEIHPDLDRLLATCSRFIDFGSADGYFAVGAACRGVRVRAFDVASSARAATAALAAANSVEVAIGTRATVRTLPLDGALILCDIDGAEADVFDKTAVKAIASTSLIVELHDVLRPGVTDLLSERFSSTHTIKIIEMTDRTLDYPEISVIPPEDRGAAISEQRAGVVTWGVFEPRA